MSANTPPHSTQACQPIEEWIAMLASSLANGTLVKITMGHYTGSEDGLKSLQVRPVLIRNEKKLSFTYRYQTRDITKNADAKESVTRLRQALTDGFQTGTLFTTELDLTLEQKMKGRGFLRRQTATHRELTTLSHDHLKKRLIAAAGKPYLQALGITDIEGTVKKKAQDKYRQINRYVELLAPMMTADMHRVVDMGAGKGYLTFALYDYMMNAGLHPQITGVEQREDLVSQCTGVARQSGFSDLQFVQGTISSYPAEGIDILIALHACDTATDDALAKGISVEAKLIVVAPCCHHQIRREMEKPANQNHQDPLRRYGIFLERQAEMVTDAIRALILEYSGYETKVFEFISDAHTAKNIMIVGRKNADMPVGDPLVLEKIREAKSKFGIETHYLETLL